MKYWLLRFTRKRILLVLLTTLALGGVTSLILDRVFFSKPKSVSYFDQNSTNYSPISHALEAELGDPCEDLYKYVCNTKRVSDPTGEVKRDPEGEVEVLRIYERIIRNNKKLSSHEIDEILVRKVYTPARTKQVRDLFEKTRARMIQFIDSQPSDVLGAEEKALMKKKLLKARLELPPPAAVYADEPDLFTRNDVFYERTRDGGIRIRLGGALLFTVKSRFNLAFTLAHELAHAIDPCELHAENLHFPAYQNLVSCFGAEFKNFDKECQPEGKVSEVFADWVATHIVAQLLEKNAPKYSKRELNLAVYNSVRDLCHDDVEDEEEEELFATDDGVRKMASTLSSRHPASVYRVNEIFAQHPLIRKLLGCPNEVRYIQNKRKSYCVWETEER